MSRSGNRDGVSKSLPAHEGRFVHPRYWGIWLAVGFLRLTSFLPYAGRVMLGGAILLSAHFVSLEMGLRLLSRAQYGYAVYRPQNNPLLEEAIRRTPDQYLWVHTRFKTRRDGEPDVYTR